jgi:hypothetical protein
MNAMPTRWSYSSVTTYESCPAKWKYSYLDNLPYAPSAAMARGSRLHSDCEGYVKGELMVLPFELKKVALRIEDYKQKGAKAEEVWLLDRNWKPVGSPAMAWSKSIVDVHWFDSAGTVLHVCDYKSGREYPEHRDQLKLYATMGLCTFPAVKRAEYHALYLDGGHTSNEGALLRGDMLDNSIKEWTSRAIRIFEDKQFLPNPGGACKWCDYSAKKGGPCEAGV